MKLNTTLLFIAVSVNLINKAVGQDFIRIGAAHDFSKNKVVQTFSFDFNRTEKIDEKKGRFLLFDHNNFYILPTSDVNIGDGITSSENNILFQINMGKAFYGKEWKNKDNLRTSAWNKAMEFNPSYNSDKLFQEKLVFGQFKFLVNLISQKHKDKSENTYIQNVHSLTFGGFSNIGYRYSKTYDTDNLYSNAGILMDYKTRILNSKNVDNWIFKVTGNYYHIISDVQQLTNDNFGGIIKSSIDRLIFKNTYIGLSHKYGNDNPNYKYVNTLEISTKIRY
ncbi:hypothetical protein B0I03_1105 [Flavobacterium aquaticum]|uniref:DUF481 domain-containing protein n=1 Tax=Flavobacterium aquaticum TaxID=1236486 RepID=A0A327YEU8_9FLAO|nr:hypothetical protein [Flavobacterium aquaticum]RAK19578.1 hypothetical protein B0I03_1105 [Flavobacterium aquaticum]